MKNTLQIHKLKTWPEYFEACLSGKKTFEVRKNDRNFQVGDILLLNEGSMGGNGMTDHDITFIYTGRQTSFTVTYVLDGGKFGIEKGYCVLGIKQIRPI